MYFIWFPVLQVCRPIRLNDSIYMNIIPISLKHVTLQACTLSQFLLSQLGYTFEIYPPVIVY